LGWPDGLQHVDRTHKEEAVSSFDRDLARCSRSFYILFILIRRSAEEFIRRSVAEAAVVASM